MAPTKVLTLDPRPLGLPETLTVAHVGSSLKGTRLCRRSVDHSSYGGFLKLAASFYELL